jgi:2-iminobutanoate/2-iminopropanoate deaminase
MKIFKILTLAILCLVSCEKTSKETKTEKTATYIETEEFSKMGYPFCEAVRYGDILYLSGQIGDTGNSDQLVEGGITEQTRQTMLNIKRVLEENGSSLDLVIKCTCMLADIKDWAEMSKAYVEFFPNHKPARSAFGTTGLALGALVEIECMAYVKN